MYLYENNGQFIDVYKLEPKLEQIIEYKKREIEKIAKKERVWEATTNYRFFLEENIDVIDGRKLNECISDDFGTDYHDFRISSDYDEVYKKINLYFTDLNSHRFFRIKNSENSCRYIVLLQENYDVIFHPNKVFIMDGIISVPRSLYLFEAFLNQRFDLLKSSEIDNLLKLFDIQHIGRVNTNVLKNICEYELLCDSYDDIINRTTTNINLVNKVKKLAR